MNPIPLLLAFAVGAAVGLVYFGGLWLTVRRVLDVRQRAVWLLASFLVRAGVTLLGLYLVIGTDGLRLAAAMAGFLVVRMALVGLLRPRTEADCKR